MTPIDVTLDGLHGKEIDLVVPLDAKIAACNGDEYKSWTLADGGDRYNQAQASTTLSTSLMPRARRW